MNMQGGEQVVTSRGPSKGLLAKGAVAGALLMAGLAPNAQAKPNVSKVPPVPAPTAAQRIQNLLRQHQTVKFEPNFNVIWSHPNSKSPNQKYSTQLPIVAQDRGQTRYFELLQKGRSLSTVKVIELPNKGLIKAETGLDAYYNCGNAPSTTGVVKLNPHFEPVVSVSYPNGKLISQLEVGQTENIGASTGTIINIGPPLPPGACPPPAS